MGFAPLNFMASVVYTNLQFNPPVVLDTHEFQLTSSNSSPLVAPHSLCVTHAHILL